MSQSVLVALLAVGVLVAVLVVAVKLLSNMLGRRGTDG
jgi:hypothetical protein